MSDSPPSAPVPVPIETKAFYIPCLDGLRAISFFLVFFSHAWLKWLPAGLGVTIFFFLSGFLITTLLRMEWERTQAISLRKFYLRRVLRIFPPLYITYLLVVAMHLILSERLGLPHLSTGALLMQGSHLTNYYLIAFGETSIPVGTNVLWSLAVEEHYYLLYPFLVSVLCARVGGWNRRSFATVLSLLCALGLTWRLILVWYFHAPAMRVFAATDTRIDSIIFGCILGACANPILGDLTGKSLVSKALGNTAVCVSVSVLLVLASALVAALPPAYSQTFGFTLQGLAMIPLFAYVVGNYRSRWVSWLESAPLVFVGRLTYTLYLVHFSVILVCARWLGSSPAALSVVSLGISLAYAFLVQRYIESPCTKLRRNLESVLVGGGAT